MQIEIVGVYPVEAAEPCHLIELSISDVQRDLDLADFTQSLDGQPRSSWQVPYDEIFLNAAGDAAFDQEDSWSLPDAPDCRVAFFFHYLDISKLFDTPNGPMKLPEPLQRPNRLQFIKYEAP
ncbi:MAG: hypothetical protein OER56_08995 [Hyphomicrobiales bacterium]|nr:hypothetical protein [Hyphomicrobiales bacterium]